MSSGIATPELEETPDLRDDETPSRDEDLAQSENGASTKMMLASRPRIFDR